MSCCCTMLMLLKLSSYFPINYFPWFPNHPLFKTRFIPTFAFFFAKLHRMFRHSCILFFNISSSHFFPASGQAVIAGVVHSHPRFLPPVFIAHRFQQSHCSSMFHRELLTYALALSACQFVQKKKSQQIYTSMHSVGLEHTKLTYLYQARE